MTSLLLGHEGAAISKAGFNALPKGARTGVVDRTLDLAAPQLLIFAVTIDHLTIKSRDVISFLLHISSDVRHHGSGAKPCCRGQTPAAEVKRLLQGSHPAAEVKPCFFLLFHSSPKEFPLLSISSFKPCFTFCVCVYMCVCVQCSGWPQSAQSLLMIQSLRGRL